MVADDRFRFDFSHFGAMTPEEIKSVEKIVNDAIRQNTPADVKAGIPMQAAKDMGAMALFGEKYGDTVRVVTFDESFSVELCGGTHVQQTGDIGLFKIISESGIAAGVRRIEALTGKAAEDFVYNELESLESIKTLFKNQPNTVNAVKSILEQHSKLQKEIEKLNRNSALQLTDSLISNAEEISGVKFICKEVELDVNQAKTLAQNLRTIDNNIFTVLALKDGNKVNLIISISDGLVKAKGMNAGSIIREISTHINGGGGGQPFLATAGGKNASGIKAAFDSARNLIK
jgi:Alanyl-tRNA synthetase